MNFRTTGQSWIPNKSIANILVSAYPQSTNCEIGELYSDNTDENSRAYGYWAKGRRGLVQLERYLRRRTRYSTSLMGCLLCGNRLIQPCTARNQEPGKSDIVKSPQKRGKLWYAVPMLILCWQLHFCQAYNSNTAEQELGIPYMETLQTTVAPHYERGTLASVYRKIAADLEEGIPLINDDAYSIPQISFQQESGICFLPHVFYLYYMQPVSLIAKK